MRLPNLFQWEVVRVTWIDATGTEEGWNHIGDDEATLHTVVTVGQVHSQSPEDILICLSWDTHTDRAGGWISIPAVNIIDLQRFE